MGWGNQGVDSKHRGRRVRQRKAGLGRQEGLCEHKCPEPQLTKTPLATQKHTARAWVLPEEGPRKGSSLRTQGVRRGTKRGREQETPASHTAHRYQDLLSPSEEPPEAPTNVYSLQSHVPVR